MDEFELYKKKERFTKEEIAFLKTKIKKSNFLIKYAFYKKESKVKAQIALIIDQMPFCPRRSAVENNWEVICERPISNIEYHEEIENYGCNNRRFITYYYRDIDALIIEDLKYHIETPDVFIKECLKRGYNGNHQTKIEFNTYDDNDDNN